MPIITPETEHVTTLLKATEQSLKPTYEQLETRLANVLRRCDEHREAELLAVKQCEEETLRAGEQIATLTVEYERRMEKLERSHEIEVANLKHEIQMQDKALEKHAGLETLNVLLMKQCVNFAERVVSE